MSISEDTTIIKHRKEVNYTTLYNDCINDENLNTDCLAILVYLMSKPDDFKIIVKHISNRFRIGRDKTYRAINDLISYGYMERNVIRNEDGSISRTVIYASDKPIFSSDKTNYSYEPIIKQPLPGFQEVVLQETTNKQPLPGFQEVVSLEENNHKKQSFNEISQSKFINKADKQPLPGFQEVVPYIQNKEKTTTTNLGIANTEQESIFEGRPVVVFLIDKIRKLPNFDVSEEQMESWVSDHGADYVDEKIDLMKRQKSVSSVGGYLRTAIKHNWKIPAKSAQPEKKEIEIQKPSESNEDLYDKVWFDSLSEEEKRKVYDGAKIAWPIIEEATKLSKISFSDPDFSKSTWFKPMVDAYRRYYRL